MSDQTTWRIILRSGTSFDLTADSLKTSYDPFGNLTTFDVDGATKGLPQYMRLAHVDAIVKVK